MTTVFDPHRLHEIAKEVPNDDFDIMVEVLVERLVAAYPDHIDNGPLEWYFNLTGGATGTMCLLHGSLTEYLLVYGTSIGTHGFSGRYRIDIYDFVLAGEISNQSLETPGNQSVARPGDMVHLQKGKATAYRAAPGSWMLEYARGQIFTAMPMGLADAVFRGLDGTTIWRNVARYTRLATRELLKGKI